MYLLYNEGREPFGSKPYFIRAMRVWIKANIVWKITSFKVKLSRCSFRFSERFKVTYKLYFLYSSHHVTYEI